MRNGSHTWIGIIREHLEAWRKANDWSRETMAMYIVEAHLRIGADVQTGIRFDPPSRDPFERAKANADRVFRWLDDATKDNNLLPANFMPSIIEALPMDRRMALLNALLAPAGVATRAMPKQDVGDSTVMIFKKLVHGTAEANSAVADLLDGIDPGELERAQAAISEANRHLNDAMQKVEFKANSREETR